MSKLTMVLEGETHIVVTRRFEASVEQVYRAHIEPELVKQWMLGPPGWTMPDYESDPRPGGSFRYVWAGDEGSFSVTGEFIELDPPNRIVHVERMHMPDATPDNRIDTRFEADGGGTLMTMRMTLPDAEVREQMLAMGMVDGMEASFSRIDELF